MYSILLAATTGGAVDLSGVTGIVQSIADGLFKLGAPVAMIGIVIGAILTWLGYQHGPHTLRNSFVALVLVLAAKVLIPALFAGG